MAGRDQRVLDPARQLLQSWAGTVVGAEEVLDAWDRREARLVELEVLVTEMAQLGARARHAVTRERERT